MNLSEPMIKECPEAAKFWSNGTECGPFVQERRDLRVTFVWRVVGLTWLEFVVLDHAPESQDDEAPIYSSTGDSVGAGCEIEDAMPNVRGYVKWDGCCEFETAPHICGLDDMDRFAEVLRSAIRLGRHLNSWDPYVADDTDLQKKRFCRVKRIVRNVEGV